MLKSQFGRPTAAVLAPSHRLPQAFVCALAVALTLLAPTPSALGAPHLRHERERAGRHAHRGRHGRRARAGSAIKAATAAATTTTTAALLGDEALESNRDSLIGGQGEAFPFQAGASGTAGAVHVYVDTGNAATTLLVGVYTNVGGRPGSLLVKGSLAAPPAGAWDTASVAPTPLASGTTYWLAVLGTGGTLRYRDRAHGSCRALTSAQTNLQTLAAAWSSGTAYLTCPISAYVTAATVTFPVGPPVPVELGPPPPPPTPPSEPSPPSEPTPPVESPPAPTNSAPPTISGTTTEGQRLSATTGTWTGSPTSYTYQWQDCNTSGATCANVGGTTSSTYTLTATDVGHTIRVIVTATGTGGSTPATSAATAVIAAPPPPPPPSPPTASFTYSPSSPVTGQAITLDGTGSTCPDGPCTYAWSDDGGPIRPLPARWSLGAGQTLRFTFSGAGTKYVRLAVTDAAGREATVEHNIVVEAPPPPTEESEPPPVEKGETKGSCFAKPSECGYPDATNTGVPAGTTLEPSGEIVVTTNGAVIRRKNVSGSIQVEANNVTIEESEITVDGSQACPGNTKPCGGYGIRVYEGYTGTVIAHDTIHGGAEAGPNALQNCVNNEGGATTTVTYTYAYHCTFGHGSGTWEDNYSLLNLTIPELHYDNFIDDGYAGKLVLRHNTFFNPHEQTSEILLQDQFGNIGEAVVEGNLLAGGGYLIYGGEGAHTEAYKVVGPVIVKGNRFARCAGTSETSENGKICKGLAVGASDGHGYFPRGGFYGVFAHFDEAVTTYSGNYWDNNLEAVVP